MASREQIENLVLEAIEEINQELEEDDRIPPSLATVLSGPQTEVDSLNLVNLIVRIEENIEDKFDFVVALADDNAITTGNNPFNSVETLIHYICGLLRDS